MGKELSTAIFAIVISRSKVLRHALLLLGLGPFLCVVALYVCVHRLARFQLKQASV